MTHFVIALGALLPAMAAAAGGLTIEASSRQLLPGRETPVVLTVRGAPEQIHRLHLGCTHGTLSRPTPVSATEAQAKLVAPGTPGGATWVLCGAAAPGGQAMVALELLRRETLPLSLLTPMARVEVKIGASTYGPVRANADGIAEVPVVLTPSALEAEVTVAPPGGTPQRIIRPLSINPGEQVLVLPPPGSLVADGRRSTSLYLFTLSDRGEPANLRVTVTSEEGAVTLSRTGPGLQVVTFTPHPRALPADGVVTAQTSRSRPWVARVPLAAGVRPSLSIEVPVRGVPADGLSSVEVAVRVTDQAGRGLVGQPVRLSARSGWVSPLEERPGGTYVARYVPPLELVGETALTAELEGAPPASYSLALTPPPRLAAELMPREIPADGSSRALLKVIARGPDGRLVPDGTEVELSTTLGTITPLVTTTRGRATAELLAGRQAGEVAIVVRALEAVQTLSTRLLPGPAAHLEIAPERPVLVCDGRDSTLLRVRVRDAFGNPIDGLSIQLSDGAGPGPRGTFERVGAPGNGEFSFRYTAPAGCEPRRHELAAAAGAARGATWVGLRHGHSRPLGLTVRLGGRSRVPDPVPFGELEVEGEARTAALAGHLLASATGSVSLGLDPLAAGPWRAASLYLGPKWSFLEDERLFLYAGGGLDAHVVLEEASAGTPVFGAHLRVGGGWALGPGFATLQVRYGHVYLVSGPALRGQLGGLSFSAGYQLPL